MTRDEYIAAAARQWDHMYVGEVKWLEMIPHGHGYVHAGDYVLFNGKTATFRDCQEGACGCRHDDRFIVATVVGSAVEGVVMREDVKLEEALLAPPA